MFITRNGRHVPEPATDQAGSEALIRTVSRYTDGKPTDRPHLCVSTELTGGDAGRAQAIAEQLDRRGYLPPEQPMTRTEFDALDERAVGKSVVLRAVIWAVCGQGLPIPFAIEGHCPDAAPGYRRKVEKVLHRIGWSGDAPETQKPRHSAE